MRVLKLIVILITLLISSCKNEDTYTCVYYKNGVIEKILVEGSDKTGSVEIVGYAGEVTEFETVCNKNSN